MSTEYITLKNKDERFADYLWGTFSSEQISIPVKSYNLGTPDEMITFEIKKNATLVKPELLTFLFHFFKLRNFIIVLLPIVFIFNKNVFSAEFQSVTFLLASVATLTLLAALNVRNDVNDHVSGFDRVNSGLVKKPIAQGWITARKSLEVSNFLFGIGALLGLSCLYFNFQLVYPIAVALLFFVLGKIVKNNSYKNQHFGEFVFFILVGPALVAGLQIAAVKQLTFESLVFGVLWGAGVLFLIQMNNFSHLMTSSQHQIRNTITKLGFDLSQKFLIFCWSVFLLIWFFFQNKFHNNFTAWSSTFVLFGLSLALFKKLLNIKSPMGSGLSRVRNFAYKVFLVAAFVLCVQSFDFSKVF